MSIFLKMVSVDGYAACRVQYSPVCGPFHLKGRPLPKEPLVAADLRFTEIGVEDRIRTGVWASLASFELGRNKKEAISVDPTLTRGTASQFKCGHEAWQPLPLHSRYGTGTYPSLRQMPLQRSAGLVVRREPFSRHCLRWRSLFAVFTANPFKGTDSRAKPDSVIALSRKMAGELSSIPGRTPTDRHTRNHRAITPTLCATHP